MTDLVVLRDLIVSLGSLGFRFEVDYDSLCLTYRAVDDDFRLSYSDGQFFIGSSCVGLDDMGDAPSETYRMLDLARLVARHLMWEIDRDDLVVWEGSFFDRDLTTL